MAVLVEGLPMMLNSYTDVEILADGWYRPDSTKIGYEINITWEALT
jgi:hypothetical protein